MSNSLLGTIRDQIASDVQLSEEGGLVRIGMPLVYDDGDSCGFYLDRDAAGKLFVTDMGDILLRASYHDADLLAQGYRTRLDKTMAYFGIAERDGSMTLPVDESRIGDAIFNFAQASLDMVKLSQLPKERKKKRDRQFRLHLSEVIKSVVPSERLIDNWRDEVIDPDNVYPVDFRIVADDNRAWYVFGVGSEKNCWRAAVSCHRYKEKHQEFTGLAIYRDREVLPRNATKPLDDIVEEKITKVENDGDVKRFIRDRILAKAG